MSTGQALVAIAGSVLLSLLLVGASLRYARRRGMLDKPGQRRSHQVPTPRGGGLGLVLACLPVLAWAWCTAIPWLSWINALALLAALLSLLLVGWLDDHRDLPSLPRLLVHLVAAMVLALVVLGNTPGWASLWMALAGAALVLATAWSINLHNFMDGIDALLGVQLLFYFAVLGVCAWWLGASGVALACAGVAAATVGFLCYNRPPARIFMGDVGSITLGWLVACMAALLWRHAHVGLWIALVLASSFIADASLTLLRRMLGGRRWYTAHREHAYQWLVRSGWSHGRTSGAYLLWNLLVALPAAIAMLAWPRRAPLLLACVGLLDVMAYLGIRRYCRDAQERRRRGAA